MSGAVALAAVAGVLAATAAVELAAAAGRWRVAASWRGRGLALLTRLGHRLGAPSAPRDLDARLAAAGRPLGLRPGDVMAVKGAGAVLGLALALPAAAVMPGRLSLVVPVALPAAAFLAPDAWLRRRTRVRARAMDAELPDLLDLMRVALGAGLSLERALAEVARRGHGALAREWRTAAVEIELGVAREDALAGLLARCRGAGMAPLVAALHRAARHGAPLVEALTALAADTRAARGRRLQERAARAAPKIQLVVALLLVPSVLLLVAAALLATFTG